GPALSILFINAVLVALLYGIVETRFRNVAPLLESLVQLAFSMSPIVWTAQTLTDQGGAVAERAALAKLNPLYHYLEIVRGPMINVPVEASSWYIVLAMTVVGLGLALLAMRK